MKNLLKPVLKSIVVASCAVLPANILGESGTVTLNINSGILTYPDTSSPIPDSALVLLVADPLNNGFGGPAFNSYVTGDDVVLGYWSLGGFPDPGKGEAAFAGADAIAANTDNPNTLNPGDPLRLYWYPTITGPAQLTTGGPGGGPGAGTAFGTYRSDLSGAPVDGSAAWVVPSLSATANLILRTASAGGQLPNSDGLASQTVVPEPSTWAAIAGLGCLGFGLVRRRMRQS